MEKRKKADCKLIEKQIPKYLENKLSSPEVSNLLNHVKTCKNCREELTIQYMVTEGLNKAETDNDYNLVKSLNERLEDSVKQVKNHEFLIYGFLFCIISVICMIVASVMKIIL